MAVSKFGMRGRTDQGEILQDIKEELITLNGLMSVLVDEHLRHFQEWREKNER